MHLWAMCIEQLGHYMFALRTNHALQTLVSYLALLAKIRAIPPIANFHSKLISFARITVGISTGSSLLRSQSPYCAPIIKNKGKCSRSPLQSALCVLAVLLKSKVLLPKNKAACPARQSGLSSIRARRIKVTLLLWQSAEKSTGCPSRALFARKSFIMFKNRTAAQSGAININGDNNVVNQPKHSTSAWPRVRLATLAIAALEVGHLSANRTALLESVVRHILHLLTL